MVLSLYDESIEDYGTVQELSDSLGEVIKADLSNIQSSFSYFAYRAIGLGCKGLRLLIIPAG